MRLHTLGGVKKDLRQIEFTEALTWLQGLIDSEVTVLLNHYGRFFGFGQKGTLRRVETLPPDNVAIRVVLGDGEGLFLDPQDVTAFIGVEASGRSWIELRTSFGPVVTFETPGDSAD